MDFDPIFRDICTCPKTGLNKDAYDFCYAFFRWIHCQDDLIDRDVEVPRGAVAIINYTLFHNLVKNPFVQAHGTSILTAVLTSSQAWIDSEEWKKRPEVLDRIASQVLKSQYQDLFLLVAGLVGGQMHMQEMAKRYRAYNYDKE